MNRLLISCALLVATAGWPQGHRIESGRVVVDPSHWQNWVVPSGTVRFSPEGVKPQFIRGRINAALDASAFVYGEDAQGGIRAAGTRLAEAANIIDGREDSFWEPDLNAPLRDWWVEIDLGRLVWAQKIVVKFAPEGMGDPFLQFKLLTANGLPAFSQSKTLRFVQAGRSEGLNKTQRVFEFDLKPTQEVDKGFVGDMFQFIQIVVTASDRDQALEISQNRWEQLPPEDRGAVLYFLRESSGVLRQIDQRQYQALTNPERQGPVKYYRRERPRLAEVEVWTEGDNISLGTLDRGGVIGGTSDTGTERLAIDGEYKTVWTEQVGVSGDGQINVKFDRELQVDLGAWFWISRAVLSFDRENIASGFTGAFPNYILNLSEGARNPDGSLAYVALARRETSEQESGFFPHIFYQDNVFPLTKARYFKMDYRVLLVPNWANSGIRELQLYGRGFLPQVALTSEAIELGSNPRVLSSIHWVADTPPGTQVQVRTRTGNQLKEVMHYFTNTGLEVSEERYRKLLSFQRGDSTRTVLPGEDWSPWSPFYLASGAAIRSPSPRRYVMIEAVLSSEDPEQAVLLERLEVRLANPLASQVLAEVTPDRVQQRGGAEIFTLYLQPRFQADSRGFDQVLVTLPPGTAVDLVDVRLGTAQALEAGGGQVYGAEQLERVASGPDSLWVRLPERVALDQALVALRFSGVLYLASNAFGVQVGLGEGAERMWQRVDAGEASGLGEGHGLTVFTPFDGQLLGQVSVSANPFTPNGDGINDVVVLRFPVFKVLGSKTVLLEVYSLSGDLVQRVEQPVQYISGQQQMVWDGRDHRGRLMPPGMYLCRVGLEVDAQGKEATVVKLVGSVY